MTRELLHGKGTWSAEIAPMISRSIEGRKMTDSFWKNALASLPLSVQRRHAADFEMAERLDRSLDLALEAWNFALRVLARTCCIGAYTLRVGAHALENTAERLLLVY